MLNKGFELAEQAMRFEKRGENEKALTYFTASIDAFSSAAAMLPAGRERDLVQSEVNNLKERRAVIKATIQADKDLESRMQRLQQSSDMSSFSEDELQERLRKLRGTTTTNDEAGIGTDELANRLKALKGDSISAKPPPTTHKMDLRGLDPEVAALIAKAEDEAALM